MINCRMCGKEMAPKPEPKMPESFDCVAHASTFLVGNMLSSDVCEDKGCQAQLQHECDEFDAWRKGE